MSLRINHHFPGWTSEENFQAVENITAKNPFAADKVCLQPAWVILSIKLSPNLESERCHGTTRHTADQPLCPKAGVSSICWQSAQGNTLASAPVSGITRSSSTPCTPLDTRNSTLIKGNASPE